MNRKIKKEVTIIIVILLLILCAFLLLNKQNLNNPRVVEDCNGRIVNTLNGQSCFSNETNLGEIKGLECPCICCKPLV